MINIGIFHRLITLTWKIVTAEGLDGVAEDKISTITQSTSEDIIYKSEMSRLKNPTQVIKLGSFHQLIPRTWHIVTAEGLGPGQAILCILRNPHLTDSYSCDFENLKNLSLESQTKCEKMLSDPIWS